MWGAEVDVTDHQAHWRRHSASEVRSLELTLPYANPRELLMDVQRYGADAEIIAPAELREQMRGMLAAALGRYAAG